MARKASKSKPRPTPQLKAEVRAAYIAGEGGLRELAKRFRLSERTLARWSEEDGWVADRQRIASAGSALADARAVESVAQMLEKHRRSAARIGELTLAKLEREALAEKGISSNALERLSLVLARMAPMERLAAGLDRAKPALGVLDDDGTGEVVCEIDPPDEEAEEPAAAPAAAKPTPVAA
jgi:transposase